MASSEADCANGDESSINYNMKPPKDVQRLRCAPSKINSTLRIPTGKLLLQLSGYGHQRQTKGIGFQDALTREQPFERGGVGIPEKQVDEGNYRIESTGRLGRITVSILPICLDKRLGVNVSRCQYASCGALSQHLEKICVFSAQNRLRDVAPL
jgi:hypothetical protein